jgi:hypothetical protein
MLCKALFVHGYRFEWFCYTSVQKAERFYIYRDNVNVSVGLPNFTIFQDRSLRVTHNLAIFGGGGMVLSIITGLFGINVDGIPGAQNTPYAFGLFTGLLFFLGIVLVSLGMLYLGLQNPVNSEKVKVRKLELQQLVSMFQHEAEQHGKVREGLSRHGTSSSSTEASDEGYILIS